MGDHQSAGLFSDLYAALAHNLDKKSKDVQKDRRALAAKIRSWQGSYDFDDNELASYSELLTLGLAKHCKVCDNTYTDWSEDEHGKGVCEED